MRITVPIGECSNTAMLAAIKKQQVFADWHIESIEGNSYALSYSKAKTSLSGEDCDRLLREQLRDEILREKLERDFGNVRDMLVNAALSPIINNTAQ